ncbi:MAG: hypothetical protein M1610_09710 [Nitrospirae bacterium]|nr:hypothetical protein [Nitrospirota bacterium]MDA8215776.1 hypothetical protein [Nitrospiraceae bacterium]MDA8338847.1 hypothetical protein [Nitrospiraceae bacterium]
MTGQQLKEYCEAEFENIASVLTEIALIVAPTKTQYTTAELAAIATFIHNCYNGIENVLKRISSYSKLEIKDTSTWHKDLLKASLDQGIITNDLYNALSIYLSFRHFFVHAYSFALRWEEMKPLVDDIEDTLKKFKSETYDYIDKLD